MYCQNCGKESDQYAQYCQFCGHTLGNYSEVIYGAEGESKQDEQMAAFVGKGYDYYQKNWTMVTNPGRSVNWNWAAFFLGVFWLGYRKMYKAILLLLGFFILTDLIELLSGNSQIAEHLSTAIMFGVPVFLGMYGNTLYYRHAKAKLSRLQEREQDLNVIATVGGTSGKGVVGAVFLLIGYVFVYGILLAIFNTGGIVFGTEQGSYGVNAIQEEFTQLDEIFYEVDFGETIDGSTVQVRVYTSLGDTETLYAEFDELLEPGWDGYFNYLYSPEYDWLEPGKYIVRVYYEGEMLSEGSFTVTPAYN
ncbi:DUF2628 domain-containing protein [Amphibacillus marinus]|nr:DUF2628 domain-containing protein [Amphibacillus marinus]